MNNGKSHVEWKVQANWNVSLINLIDICAHGIKPTETKTSNQTKWKVWFNSCQWKPTNNANIRVKRSDVPFHFKAHRVNASVSSYVDLFVAATPSDVHLNQSPPNRYLKMLHSRSLLLCVSLCMCAHSSLHLYLHHK